MDEIIPLVYVPWPPALPNPALVLPHFLAIASTGVEWLHLDAYPAAQGLNMAAEELLKRYNTHLITLDWDHQHPEGIIRRFVNVAATNPEIKILSGLNYMRGEPHLPCAWLMKDGKYYRPHAWKEPGILEVEYTGFGAVMIHREVFEQIERPWFMYDYSQMAADDYKYPGPDIYFCRKARAAGIKIYCDFSLTSPHIGTKLVGESEYREYYERQRDI